MEGHQGASHGVAGGIGVKAALDAIALVEQRGLAEEVIVALPSTRSTAASPPPGPDPTRAGRRRRSLRAL
jgi:hypothetical protein